jgi:hypothetical protein
MDDVILEDLSKWVLRSKMTQRLGILSLNPEFVRFVYLCPQLTNLYLQLIRLRMHLIRWKPNTMLRSTLNLTYGFQDLRHGFQDLMFDS